MLSPYQYSIEYHPGRLHLQMLTHLSCLQNSITLHQTVSQVSKLSSSITLNTTHVSAKDVKNWTEKNQFILARESRINHEGMTGCYVGYRVSTVDCKELSVLEGMGWG